ncbi:MAG: HtrA protease/chaperone protein [Devosia sp.]|uniref:Do family serine endopeptidase n=1 Tax=Devosia sp. TaxID=1871048 RepID=UPI00260748CC|nr:Do family serine endopeptidase [Devosia sp.]MDB5527737.1 HtrA protease/chaperone protein [Devosia sp.]
MGRFVIAGLMLAAVLAASPAYAQAEPQGPKSVAALAAQLSPAVVNIGSSRHVAGGTPFPEFPDGSPLEDMFDHLNPNDGQGKGPMQQATSLGSGFIISADGYIVTNNHVIDGAEEIQVYLTDGRRLPAKLAGHDDKTDLAVLKIESPMPLPFVQFGDSDSAQVGDWVMAIGNPFGLGGSVTLGIVSARNRDIEAGPYDNFIQTDASINQGNSGGPLFDMYGKVVGINTAIIARGGSSLGIGFAVPGNLAAPVVRQLTEFGETRRGWLGVGIQEVTDDIALSLDRPNTNGAMVVDIDPAGPSIGVLLEGDVILQFDGKTVARMRDLPRIVAETEVGRAVPVKVLRNGSEEDVDITLGRLEVPGDTAMVSGTDAPVPEVTDSAPAVGLDELLGLGVAPLNDAARAEFGIDAAVNGIIITQVTDGSDAYDKGLIPGLLITEVNQKPVSSVEEIETLVTEASTAKRPVVLFKVTDPAGSSRFIAVKLG